MMPPILTRRRFLMYAACACAAAAGGWRLLPMRQRDPLAELLATLNAAAAEVVGSELAELHPDYRDAKSLRSLLAHLNGSEADLSVLYSRVAGAIQRDFSEGKTLKVAGWILSQTEARLYALRRLTALD